MKDRQILRELARMLSVRDEDVPKTLRRFKKEADGPD
jgi:hypothetical protein